jgi:hypothetical protein
MALTLAWRKLRPLIRAERTPQRTVSNEFAATSLVTTPDLTTEEIDAIVLLVEHSVVLDMTDLALTMSGALAPAFFHLADLTPRAHVGGKQLG